MKSTEHEIYVAFISKRLKESFDSLKLGKTNDQELYESIGDAINKLKDNPLSGVKIQKRLWPKEYIKRYNITNLWKYNLNDGWRIIYTIESDEVKIVSIILEWFNHKNYEKRFKY